MLELLRRKRNNPIIATILGLIILVFIVFFGPSLNSCGGSSSYAARVNGETIAAREFSQRYTSMYSRYQQQFNDFNRDMAKTIRLRENVLDDMIHTKLLTQLAKKRGLAVDDEALRAAILNYELFQTAGRFDKAMYERVLSSNGVAPAEFEASFREQLLSDKLRLAVVEGLDVPESEVRAAYEKQGRSINVEFVRFRPESFQPEATAPDPAAVQAYLASEGADAAIQKYYDRYRRSRFDVPEKVRARHILIRLLPDGPPDLKAEAKQKLQKIAAEIKSGAISFEEAAKKHSDDSTKDRGGDLGFFSRGQMVAPFEKAAFELEPGQTSGLVESPFGLHLIKVEEKQAPLQRKLEDVKTEIAGDILKEKSAEAIAEKRAQALIDAVRGGQTLSASAQAAGQTMEETGSFSHDERDFIPKIGADKGLNALLWGLRMDKPLIEKPYRGESALVVAQLKERVDPDPKDFEQKQREIAERLRTEKVPAVVESWLKHLRSQAQIEIREGALSYDEPVSPDPNDFAF